MLSTFSIFQNTVSNTEEEILQAISIRDIPTLKELLSQPSVTKNMLLSGAVCVIEQKNYDLLCYFTTRSVSVNDILTLAVEKSLIDVIYNLQNIGAYYDFELTNGYTILSHAALCHSIESMDALLRCGANMDKRSTNGNTVLNQIVKQDDTYFQVVRYLITEGANINSIDDEGLSVYERSIHMGNFNMLRELLNYKNDVNYANDLGITLLMTACCRQQEKCVDLLLSMGADVNMQTPVGETALMKTIRYTHLEQSAMNIVQLLLKHGADINIADDLNETCFYTAVELNHMRLVDLFLAREANVMIQNTWNITPFILAIGNGNIDLAEYFIGINGLLSVSNNNTHWFSNTTALNNVIIELTNNSNKKKCRKINSLFFGSGESIPYAELENPHDIAKEVFKQPLESLQEQVRYQIRKHLYNLSPINLISKIHRLPIPLLLKQYLSYV